MLSDVGRGKRGGGGGAASVQGVQSLFFLLQKIENWICAMTRHHAESDINMLLKYSSLNDTIPLFVG